MFNFKQKDDEFFDLFLESAKFFHAGALILDEVIQDYKTTASGRGHPGLQNNGG